MLLRGVTEEARREEVANVYDLEFARNADKPAADANDMTCNPTSSNSMLSNESIRPSLVRTLYVGRIILMDSAKSFTLEARHPLQI